MPILELWQHSRTPEHKSYEYRPMPWHDVDPTNKQCCEPITTFEQNNKPNPVVAVVVLVFRYIHMPDSDAHKMNDNFIFEMQLYIYYTFVLALIPVYISPKVPKNLKFGLNVLQYRYGIVMIKTNDTLDKQHYLIDKKWSLWIYNALHDGVSSFQKSKGI
jgi:hypothetical protein